MEGSLSPGTVFAGYRIEGMVGRGGMGVVYRATQLALDRPVALKLVAPEFAKDGEFRERFKRESRLAASIDHPNVITIHEAGEADGQLYISMRYVEGIDLGGLVAREGSLEPARAARVVAQVGAALDAAHARGLVHRDIKPANVLVERRDREERAYLTDFGLTKRSDTHSELTRTGQWMGTLDYAAPEQIAGGAVDARADVYALGCVLYTALAGSAPFGGREDVAKIYAHVNEEPAPVTERRPEVPGELDDVLRRALAKSPDDRFASAGDLGRAALAAAEGLSPALAERSVATGLAAPTAGAERPTEPLPGAPPTMPAATTPMTERVPAAARRLAPLGAAVALVAVAVVVAAVVLLGGDGDSALEAESFDTSSIAVGASPAGLAVGEDGVWVGVDEEDAVKRIDPDSGDVVDSIDVSEGADGSLAIGEGFVWVRSDGDTVTKIDPGSRQVVGNPIEVPIDSDGELAIGEGSVWSANPSADSIARIDPDTGRVREFEATGLGPEIAVSDGSVWVTGEERPSVKRIDPESGEVEDTFDLGGADTVIFNGSLAAGEGGVWVTNPDEETLFRIDPDSGELDGRPTRLPDGFDGDVTVGGGAVWVRSSSDGAVLRVDPETRRRVGRPISAGPSSSGRVVVGYQSAWVSQGDSDTVTRLEY
jgi:streptogramin lyase